MSKMSKNAARRGAEDRAQRRAFRAAISQRQELVDILMENRLDAVRRVVDRLFELDPVAKLYRLRGAGGPTGVARPDVVDRAIDDAVMGARDPSEVEAETA